ncbi:MAG TPA: hypothetical protein VFX20_15975 [Steroidobacteraceae bacterium]|nr:hypothetical protein [Steroidobacteraceae bacterium]
MSGERRKLLGFDQRVRLEWLEAAGGYAASGKSYAEMREALLDLLDGIVGGRRHASARSKTVTVLCRVWGGVAPGTEGIRTRAIEALSRVDASQRVALHWAMSLAAYPFFSDVASIVGRLLELQGEAPIAHIVRRTVELWGDREKVRGATQKIVRSMVDWNCLTEASSKGVFGRRLPKQGVRGELASILSEALIFGGEQEAMPLSQLIRHPAAFPFRLEVTVHDLRQFQCFEINRQGLDIDVVSLSARA